MFRPVRKAVREAHAEYRIDRPGQQSRAGDNSGAERGHAGELPAAVGGFPLADVIIAFSNELLGYSTDGF